MPSEKQTEKTNNYFEKIRKRVNASIKHNHDLRGEIVMLKVALVALRRDPSNGSSKNDFIDETLAKTKDWGVEWQLLWEKTKNGPSPERMTENHISIDELNAVENIALAEAKLPEPVLQAH